MDLQRLAASSVDGVIVSGKRRSIRCCRVSDSSAFGNDKLIVQGYGYVAHLMDWKTPDHQLGGHIPANLKEFIAAYMSCMRPVGSCFTNMIQPSTSPVLCTDPSHGPILQTSDATNRSIKPAEHTSDGFRTRCGKTLEHKSSVDRHHKYAKTCACANYR